MNTPEQRVRSILDATQVLRSERFTLERFSLDFVSDAYVGWMNDPDVRRWLVSNQDGQTTRADVEQYVRGLKPDEAQFAIVDNGTHIGNIKIYDFHPVHGRMEVGYLIGDRTRWGKGVATEAVATMVRFCFDELRLHKLTSGCFDGHEASARVLSKNGFALEGVLRDHFCILGRYIDFRRYGLVAPAA